MFAFEDKLKYICLSKPCCSMSLKITERGKIKITLIRKIFRGHSVSKEN